MSQAKSVITCDLEGRIETFNQGAEEIFGYRSEEVIGRKRVSLFSPGLIVLAHVQNWLKVAREQGEFAGRTVFVRRDGTLFAADVRITPTFRHGQQIGYCGVTTPRPDVPVAQAMPGVSLATRLFSWMVITRAPFLTATLVPVIAGGVWASIQTDHFAWGLFWMVLLGALALQVAANTFNDYFDWKSGADKINNGYFMPYSGGSRSVELRLISERALLEVAWVALGVAIAAGLPFLFLRGPLLLVFGAIGAFSVYFYTAPPLRLAARNGLGEFIVGMNFGPLMTAGAFFALTGELTWQSFLVGLPIGLLTTAILWVNQFPDMEADRMSGKHNLVVMLGRERARWGYLLVVGAAFVILALGIAVGALPLGALLALLAAPLAIYTSRILFRHYNDRALIQANANTILLHLVAGLLLAAGLLLGANL